MTQKEIVKEINRLKKEYKKIEEEDKELNYWFETLSIKDKKMLNEAYYKTIEKELEEDEWNIDEEEENG